MRVGCGLLASFSIGERTAGLRSDTGGIRALGGELVATREDLAPLALDRGRARIGDTHEIAYVRVRRRELVHHALGVAARSLRDVETLVVLPRTHLRARALFLQLRGSAFGAAELLAQTRRHPAQLSPRFLVRLAARIREAHQ